MKNLKSLILFLAVISLTACSTTTSTPEATTPSPGNETVVTAPPTPPSPAEVSPVASPNPVATSSDASPVINPAEVSFKAPLKGEIIGYIDSINGKPFQTLQPASKNSAITFSGWAALPGGTKDNDMVIITTADKNVIATAPINIDRPDVVKALKKEGLKKSGWKVTIAPSKFTTDKISLIGWVYNASTKEAVPLNNVVQLTFQ